MSSGKKSCFTYLLSIGCWLEKQGTCGQVPNTVVSVLVTARATRADTTIGGSADGIVAIGIEANPNRTYTCT